MENTSDKYTREDDKRFTLRINNDIFNQITELAKINKRSVGRQIEWILEFYLTNKIK